MSYIPAKVAIANAKANAERLKASAQTTGVPHPIAVAAELKQVVYEDELWECWSCGVLTRDEVRQVERHECCMEACRYCDRDANPITIVKGESINANRKCLFHLARVPVAEGSHQTCFGVFMKEVQSKEELGRSTDKGELMGKFQDRYEAMEKVHELAKPYGEFAIFE